MSRQGERLMPMRLSPRPGFNRNQVAWDAPNHTRTEICSYCDAPLDHETSVPLIVWAKDGWCAEFCDRCKARWWGPRGASIAVDPRAAYRDDCCEPRHCHYRGLIYRGPPVDCSLDCAIADA